MVIKYIFSKLKEAFGVGTFVLALSLISRVALADSLLVYIPTTQAAGKTEKAVKAMTGASVTAFAKFSDFEAGIEAMKPDAVLSVDGFSVVAEGYQAVASMKINEGEKSKYILLSLDPSWKGKNLADAKIGAVEFIKRNKIKDYFQTIFSIGFKSIKTVSKVEDLFPLLVFKSVDVIAMQPNTYEELKEKFNTTVHEVGASQEIPALTLFQKGGGEIKGDFSGLKQFNFSSK